LIKTNFLYGQVECLTICFVVIPFFRDSFEDDLKLWLPQPEKASQDLDVEMSLFLLTHVGDQFCLMIQTEREAKAAALASKEDGDQHGPSQPQHQRIAWKRVVQGVREMCDVCETTLFNFHWVCDKCGYAVCIDCYKTRREAQSQGNNTNGSGSRDEDREVRSFTFVERGQYLN